MSLDYGSGTMTATTLNGHSFETQFKAWESAHYKVVEPGVSKTKLVATLKKFYGRHHDLVNPYNVTVSRIVSDVFTSDAP